MAKLKRVTKLKDRRAPAQGTVPAGRPESADVTDLPAPRHTQEVLGETGTAHGTDPDQVVRLAIAEELDLTPAQVTGEEHLYIDLGVDDGQLPQLLARMGEALDVRFPDDFFDGVHTVAQLTAAVRVSLSPL